MFAIGRFTCAIIAICSADLPVAETNAMDDQPSAEKKELVHTTDSFKTIQDNLASNKAILVDVRELVEWNDGHIEGAVLLPWRGLQDKPNEKDIRNRIPSDAIVYTYCAVGFRALRAGKILSEYKYDVRPLKAGYEELVKAGFRDEKLPKTADWPIVFREDFQKAADFENGFQRWETTDDKSWFISQDGENRAFGLNKRVSDYQPKFRSPHNIALIKGLELADVEIQFRVKSTNDTGDHRDCCVFFGHQDPEHFYYVHLGAKPDPASGQIMIVDGAARRPLTDNKKPVKWDDQWHTVKLVRDSQSGRIDIYFDDLTAPHLSVIDKSFTRGRIGIGSFDDMNTFDDIQVRGK